MTLLALSCPTPTGVIAPTMVLGATGKETLDTFQKFLQEKKVFGSAVPSFHVFDREDANILDAERGTFFFFLM